MAFFAKLCCGSQQLSSHDHQRNVVDSEKPPHVHDSPSPAPCLPSIASDTDAAAAHPSKQNPTGTVLDAVKVALGLLHATLDSVPVPGLKGAIGGILFVMDTFEVCDFRR